MKHDPRLNHVTLKKSLKQLKKVLHNQSEVFHLTEHADWFQTPVDDRRLELGNQMFCTALVCFLL